MDTNTETTQAPTLADALTAALEAYDGGDFGFNKVEVRMPNPSEILCRVWREPTDDFEARYIAR